jgi:hypothetical protein
MRSSVLPLVFFAAVAASAQPRVVNGTLESRALSRDLASELGAFWGAQTSAAWIGYAVPMVPGERRMCCYGADGSGCALGEGRRFDSAARPPVTTVKLEPPSVLHILFRAEKGQLTHIRVFSADCELDAGGTTLNWLTGVNTGDSLKLLESFVPQPPDSGRERRKRIEEGAITAISLHSDPGADALLEKYVAAGAPDSLRKHAAFWMGQARGSRGIQTLGRILREEQNDRVRDSALQGIALSKENGAAQVLVDAAKNDKSAHIRGQALFWLAQRAAKQAVPAIENALKSDPEVRVKEQAVFALSQLPKDQGVPLLIQVARTNNNPAVRKKAMFWLGQSQDPRALEFFEEVLGR